MENKRTKRLRLVMVLFAVLLVGNLVATGILSKESKDSDGQTKYTLYIGTNDKDTYRQEIPLDECRRIVTEICTRHTGGCTLVDASGFWRDDAGAITSEQTIQCVLEDVTEEEVHTIADEVIAAMNQSSILIETQRVSGSFYSGGDTAE